MISYIISYMIGVPKKIDLSGYYFVTSCCPISKKFRAPISEHLIHHRSLGGAAPLRLIEISRAQRIQQGFQVHSCAKMLQVKKCCTKCCTLCLSKSVFLAKNMTNMAIFHGLYIDIIWLANSSVRNWAVIVRLNMKNLIQFPELFVCHCPGVIQFCVFSFLSDSILPSWRCLAIEAVCTHALCVGTCHCGRLGKKWSQWSHNFLMPDGDAVVT